VYDSDRFIPPSLEDGIVKGSSHFRWPTTPTGFLLVLAWCLAVDIRFQKVAFEGFTGFGGLLSSFGRTRIPIKALECSDIPIPHPQLRQQIPPGDAPKHLQFTAQGRNRPARSVGRHAAWRAGTETRIPGMR